MESGGQLHRRTTKTGRARVVTLPALVVEELAEHPPGVDGLVLPLPSRRPIRAGAFRTRFWTPALEAAGLGHSSITTTLDRYGHLFPALDEALAERLDEMARGPAREAAL